jgi:hypothetical protein
MALVEEAKGFSSLTLAHKFSFGAKYGHKAKQHFLKADVLEILSCMS